MDAGTACREGQGPAFPGINRWLIINGWALFNRWKASQWQAARSRSLQPERTSSCQVASSTSSQNRVGAMASGVISRRGSLPVVGGRPLRRAVAADARVVGSAPDHPYDVAGRLKHKIENDGREKIFHA